MVTSYKSPVFFRIPFHPLTWNPFLTPWIPLTEIVAAREDRITTKSKMHEPADTAAVYVRHHTSKD